MSVTICILLVSLLLLVFTLRADNPSVSPRGFFINFRNLKYRNMAHHSKPIQKPVALAVLALIFMQSANAQTAPAVPAPAAAASAAKKVEEPQKLEAVVVSGSRIKRDSFSTPAPVTIIRNDDAVAAGFTSTAQVLQGTAVTGGQGQINNAYGGFVTEGGPGANTIGLRGFAPTRSLVLLNGRRMAPSGTRGSVGAADLNTLPSSIVDRIEVLKDGASSIYGSDAVAGVVNIITKKNLDSITVDSSTSRTVEGGGASHNFALSGGKVSDNSRFLASFQVNQQEALTLGQREWASCNADYRRTYDAATGAVGAWGSRDFIDPKTGLPKCYTINAPGGNGVTINTLGTATRPGVPGPGTTGTSFNRWRPNSSVTTGLVGYEGVSLNSRDTFSPEHLNQTLLSPVRNTNLFVQGGFDLHALGDAELYYEVLLNRRESSQVGYRQLSLDYGRYPEGNPLLPANLAALPQFGAAEPTASGVSVTNGFPRQVRAFIGFGNSYSNQEVTFNRFLAGLRGAIANTGWDYDASFLTSQSLGYYSFQSFLTDRLAQSNRVVATGTGFACANPANGCVPMPALTSAVIAGQLPADFRAYIFPTVTGLTKYREDVMTASATGPLYQLPYGNIKGAFGIELRNASIDDTPPDDSLNQNLNGLTSAKFPTRGSDRAKDFFAELEIPILKNLPGAQELTVNASSRWSNYDSYGSASTYKGGVLWTPAKWLTLRTTKGTSYRAPALFEQYLGATSGFQSGQNDPCNNWDTNTSSVRKANCQSEGLPEGFQNNTSLTILSQGGRDAGLKAETSENKTIGVVFQPELPSGWGDFSLAVDRFDISVADGVAQVGYRDILSRCYDNPSFRAGGGFCRLISPRKAGSNSLDISSAYINLASDIVNGTDITARYTNDVGIGRLRVNLSLTEFKQQAGKLFSDDPLVDSNGLIANPNWSGALDINYTVKAWNYYYGVEWVGKTSSYEYYGEDPATSTYLLDTPAYYLQSASVQYKDSVGKWSVTLGVRNLADVKPPKISQGVISRVGEAPLYSGYDYTGRRFFLNVSKTF